MGTHSVHFFDHDLHHNVLVLDVDDGCHGFPLRAHEGGAKHHAEVAGLHKVAI